MNCISFTSIVFNFLLCSTLICQGFTRQTSQKGTAIKSMLKLPVINVHAH